MSIIDEKIEIGNIQALKDKLLREKEIYDAKSIKIMRTLKLLEENPKIQEFLQILAEV